MPVLTANAPRLVFGREPAAWTALISAVLALLTTFGLNIDTETQGVILAAANAMLGLIVVITVRESVYPALVAVVQTAVPLVVAFGLNLTEQQQGAILAVATITLGFVFTRPQVTPKVDGRVVNGGYLAVRIDPDEAVRAEGGDAVRFGPISHVDGGTGGGGSASNDSLDDYRSPGE